MTTAIYRRLVLTPLSPVHIGCGEDYDPTNYIIEDGTLFAFSTLAYAKVAPDNIRQDIRRTVNTAGPTALDEIRKIIARDRLNIMGIANRYVHISPALQTEYEDRLAGRLNPDARNGLEIQRTAYTGAAQQPYLPGSSLKGAIRTAVVNMELNKRADLVAKLSRQSKQACDSGNHSGFRRDTKNIQNDILEYNNKNLEADPFRLLKISDAMPSTGTLLTEIVVANNVKRKPQPAKKEGEKSGPPNVIEIMPALLPGALTGSMVESPKPAAPLRGGHYASPGKSFSAREIADACNRYYFRLFKAELKELSEASQVDPDWKSDMENLLPKLAERMKANTGFLVRVGRYGGSLCNTLNDSKNDQPQTLRAIYRPQAKDQRLKVIAEPGTRWLAGGTRKATSRLRPFGWVWVDIDPDEAAMSLLTTQLAAHQQNAYARVARIQTIAGEKRAETERHQAEQEQRQQQKQAAERAEAERLAKLAAMTEEQKAIASLRELYGKKQTNNLRSKGDDLDDRLRLLCESGKTWPAEEKAVLRDLAREIYQWKAYDLKADKKVKERLKGLE